MHPHTHTRTRPRPHAHAAFSSHCCESVHSPSFSTSSSSEFPSLKVKSAMALSLFSALMKVRLRNWWPPTSASSLMCYFVIFEGYVTARSSDIYCKKTKRNKVFFKQIPLFINLLPRLWAVRFVFPVEQSYLSWSWRISDAVKCDCGLYCPGRQRLTEKLCLEATAGGLRWWDFIVSDTKGRWNMTQKSQL